MPRTHVGITILTFDTALLDSAPKLSPSPERNMADTHKIPPPTPTILI